jgi:hypothetical protein
MKVPRMVPKIEILTTSEQVVLQYKIHFFFIIFIILYKTGTLTFIFIIIIIIIYGNLLSIIY